MIMAIGSELPARAVIELEGRSQSAINTRCQAADNDALPFLARKQKIINVRRSGNDAVDGRIKLNALRLRMGK